MTAERLITLQSITRRETRWERVSRWESRTLAEFSGGVLLLSGAGFFLPQFVGSLVVFFNAGSIQ